MAELALDDHERHAFASHFDGVGVPQLMWSKSSNVHLRPRLYGANSARAAAVDHW